MVGTYVSVCLRWRVWVETKSSLSSGASRLVTHENGSINIWSQHWLQSPKNRRLRWPDRFVPMTSSVWSGTKRKRKTGFSSVKRNSPNAEKPSRRQRSRTSSGQKWTARTLFADIENGPVSPFAWSVLEAKCVLRPAVIIHAFAFWLSVPARTIVFENKKDSAVRISPLCLLTDTSKAVSLT